MMIVGYDILCISYNCAINEFIVIFICLNKMKGISWRNTAYIFSI